jgi:single-strand DNA-binding protein
LQKGGIDLLNQAVLVGRIVQEPELKELDNGKKVTNITLAVPRSFKNSAGEYDTDYINCVLWKGVAENTTTYCKRGDLVGIKGHIQTRTVEFEDESRRQFVEVVAEKVTFLSSKGRD